jgi:hypothetical protein
VAAVPDERGESAWQDILTMSDAACYARLIHRQQELRQLKDDDYTMLAILL